MMAAAFGTGSKTVEVVTISQTIDLVVYYLSVVSTDYVLCKQGIQKTLYPSTNTTDVYVLPYRRADDGTRRLIIASKLSIPIALTLQGGFCSNGTARVLEAAAGAQQPGFDPPVMRGVSGGKIALGAWALATVECH